MLNQTQRNYYFGLSFLYVLLYGCEAVTTKESVWIDSSIMYVYINKISLRPYFWTMRAMGNKEVPDNHCNLCHNPRYQTA